MERALGFGPRGCGFDSCQARHSPSLISLSGPYYESLSPFGFSAALTGNADLTAMLPIHRHIWLLGHRLSMGGYVNAA